MNDNNLLAAASIKQPVNEKEYWLQKLSGEIARTNIPYDFPENSRRDKEFSEYKFIVSEELSSKIKAMCNDSDLRLHIFLSTFVILLIQKYSNNKDVIIGAPIYKQKSGASFINTLLILRNGLGNNMTFKDLLIQVSQSIAEANKNVNYPVETLLYQLNINYSPKEDFPLFDVMVMLKNIHDPGYVKDINTNLNFEFDYSDKEIFCNIHYNENLYKKSTIERIGTHYQQIVENVVKNIDKRLSSLEFISENEREQLLNFSQAEKLDFEEQTSLIEIFKSVVKQRTDVVAICEKNKFLTYKELDLNTDKFAKYLIDQGVKENDVVGIMFERSAEIVISILSILKAGAAYLPVDEESPDERIKFVLKDSDVRLFLTQNSTFRGKSFTQIVGQNNNNNKIVVTTKPRLQIKELDNLPFPDRSLVNYEKYNQYLDEAMVKNCMSIQATRGCPYNCAYCHKIWPKSHFFRSADNIYQEFKLYYDIGVRRFAFIDDIFNLNRKNSSNFFNKIIQDNLNVQIFFPNGLRGDLLTEEYIDMMVEAGVVSIAVALETASPRLQKLIGKNMKLDRLHQNLEYICNKHPHIITELYTMVGFPTESKEEAKLTLNFIKDFKWIDFPFVNLLKIFPNTDMEKLAIECGVDPNSILRSDSMAFHDIPETLPFEKEFAMKYKTDFVNEYFMSEERLKTVLPHQLNVLTKDEIILKYNSYLPVDINTFEDLLRISGIKESEFPEQKFIPEEQFKVDNLNNKLSQSFPKPDPHHNALRVLLLDLSQNFSTEGDLLYNLIEPPLGLTYVMTYAKKKFGSNINGKIAKAFIDFDSYDELRELIGQFNPDIIGIRTLTFYKDFFHKTVSIIKQWGIKAPIVSGGPYATSGYSAILQDKNVDLVVLGEGEITFGELLGQMIENNNQLPSEDKLHEINGLAFITKENRKQLNETHVIFKDHLNGKMSKVEPSGLSEITADHLAYIIYTSGSTGFPKGVKIKHSNVKNLIKGLKHHIYDNYDGVLHMGLIASFTFDASIQQIFGSLLEGHTFYIIPDDVRKNGKQLVEYIGKHAIDILDGTPNHLSIMSQEEGIDKCLKHVLIGGDILHKNIVEEFLSKCKNKNIKISNVYGPTECCVDTTIFTFKPDQLELLPSIPIGKPLPNTCAYILNDDQNLLPIGLVGELFIGGKGLGNGYIGNQEQNRKCFVENPFIKGEKMYKTGDMVKWLPDSNIEFVGRRDEQVKVRGYRIELGEIRNQLLALPEIEDALVLLNRDKNLDNYIYAYVISKKGIDTQFIKESLGMTLPEYYIPHFIFRIEQFPLNRSGKIDKDKLPKVETLSSQKYIAPKSEIECKLAKIWSEILNISYSEISIDSDFFELGGHSLKAIILVSKINNELGAEIKLSEIFSSATIGGLGKLIDNQETKVLSKIPLAPKKDQYLLSPSQKRILVLQLLDEEMVTYNVPFVAKLEGKVDIDRLEKTFCKLIQRHEILRTSFEWQGKGPVQIIHDEIEFNLVSINCEEDDIEKEIQKFIKPFNLGKIPLLRAGVINVGNGDRLIVMDIHHIISDGFSMNILLKDFNQLYGNKTIGPLKIQYKDFAEWQNSSNYKSSIDKQKNYWLDQFNSIPPRINLPCDYARPKIQSYEGKRIDFSFEPTLSNRIKEFNKQNNMSAFMFHYGVLAILLSKLSNQDDITIGTPVANRTHTDIEPLIGIFLNTLAIRSKIDRNLSFKEFMLKVKTLALSSFENADYPYEDLVSEVVKTRDPERNPLFDIMLIIQNVEFEENLEEYDLTLEPYGFENKTSKYDFTLEIYETKESIYGVIEYCTALFKNNTIDRLVEMYKTFIETILENPSKEISEIEIATPNDRIKLMSEVNNTSMKYPENKNIIDLFDEQAEKNKDHVAIVNENHHMSYGCLKTKSDNLASYLLEKGLSNEKFIGFILDRSVELHITILAILKAGCAYLPFETDIPVNRIKHIINDSGINFLISKDKIIEELQVAKEGLCNVINIDEIVHLNYKRNKPVVVPNAPAYLLYTSGTTGFPKGSVVSHKNVNNLIHAINQEIPFDTDTCMLSVTSATFDIFVLESLHSFCSGAKVILTSVAEKRDIVNLPRIIEKQHINTVQLTPSLLHLLIVGASTNDYLNTVKRFLVGGEDFSEELLKSIRIRYSGEIYNMYGLTETTVYTTIKDLTEDDKISIGKPIGNTQVYILNKDMQLLPEGVVGEICIGGHGNSLGYLNNNSLNEEKFVINPINKEEKLYRTGDLGLLLNNTEIKYLGRADQQIKVRGYRIELSEIERTIERFESIHRAVVVHDLKSGNLFSYFISSNKTNTDELNLFIQKELPNYMVPANYQQVDEFPLTPSGKVDKKALPEPTKFTNACVEPRNGVDQKLVSLCEKILNVKKGTIGINHNFFEIGGNSFNAVILLSSISKEFEVELLLADIFKSQILRSLSDVIQSKEKYIFKNIPKHEKKEYYPLSYAQKRMFFIQNSMPDTISHNITNVYEIKGDLDIGKLELAFNELFKKYDILRTTFGIINFKPVQKIHEKFSFQIDQSESDYDSIEETVNDFVQAFDISKLPLLRVKLVKRPDASYLLMMDVHHIITDGVSQPILIDTLLNYYLQQQVEESQISYIDFAVWQAQPKVNSLIFNNQKQFWQSKLNDMPLEINLPYDFQRPEIQSFEGSSVELPLEKVTTRNLRIIAEENNTTMYMLGLALVNILFMKLSDQVDIIIGSALAGRRHDSLQKTVGLFVNVLPMRNYVSKNKSFKQFLNDVKEETVQAFDNQDYPFDKIVEDNLTKVGLQKNPIFNVAFSWNQADSVLSDHEKTKGLGSLSIKPFQSPNTISKLDITINTFESGDEILFVFEFCTKLFKKPTIVKFSNYLLKIIETIIDNNHILLKDISILNQSEEDLINEKIRQSQESIDADFSFE